MTEPTTTSKIRRPLLERLTAVHLGLIASPITVMWAYAIGSRSNLVLAVVLSPALLGIVMVGVASVVSIIDSIGLYRGFFTATPKIATTCEDDDDDR